MKKILIVEKDSFTSSMILESLSQLGFYSYSCNHLELPLSLINIDPDIVLINQSIFIKNRQLFFHGRERLTKSRVVITSSVIRNPIHLKEMGADSVILKPFDVDTLKNIIEKLS